MCLLRNAEGHSETLDAARSLTVTRILKVTEQLVI